MPLPRLSEGDEADGTRPTSSSRLTSTNHPGPARGALAGEERYTTRRSEREQLCDEALAIARAAGDDATLALVIRRRGTACYSPAYASERLAAAGELVELASALGDPQVRYHAFDEMVRPRSRTTWWRPGVPGWPSPGS